MLAALAVVPMLVMNLREKAAAPAATAWDATTTGGTAEVGLLGLPWLALLLYAVFLGAVFGVAHLARGGTIPPAVRNDGPVPITLFGRPPFDEGLGPHGLALLRNPAVLSTDPANLAPFEPVNLAAGGTVTVAMVSSGRSCADPAADVGSQRTGEGATMIGYPLIYETFGWRREGFIWPHFSLSVAGCKD